MKIITFRDKYLKNGKNIKKENVSKEQKIMELNHESTFEENNVEEINKDYFENYPVILFNFKGNLDFKFNIIQVKSYKKKKNILK